MNFPSISIPELNDREYMYVMPRNRYDTTFFTPFSFFLKCLICLFVRSVASFLCRHILREDPKLPHLSNPPEMGKERKGCLGVPRTNPVGTGPVAQRIRARGYEPRCRGFKSLLAHNNNNNRENEKGFAS